MIRRFNDLSFFDEESMQKIAQAVNNQKKLVKIVDNEKQANIFTKELQFKGYNVDIEQNNNNFYIYASPRQKVLLKEAQSSGQFKKIAFDRYQFLSKEANNPLGIQHYNFDEGTIWKVMTAKDGKEYLVKEIDDKDNNKVIRQPCEKAFRSTILASLQSNPKQLTKLCKVLYNNPDDDFINDLVKYSSKSLSAILTSKLDNIITSELEYLNITSPEYHKNVHDKIVQAIDNNQIYNRQQISNLIKKAV